MRIVILVPRRRGDRDRELAWNVVRPYLVRLRWPIFLGDSPGAFNRAAARNAAAEAAGNWDVAVFADADTIQEEAPLQRAVRTKGAVIPWNTRWMLNKAGTKRISLDGPPIVPSRSELVAPEHQHPKGAGATLVISRAAWDAVGGFDEGFKGYGFEDRAMRMALEAVVRGGVKRTRGTVWHLYHPPVRREVQGGSRANAARFALYAAARKKGTTATRTLLTELRNGDCIGRQA